MNPIWIDDDGVLAGQGACVELDPGVGPTRYHAALDGLVATDRSTAFASFTFDQDEPGSVVLIPETTMRTQALDPGRGAVGSTILDDGIGRWREGFRTAMEAVLAGEVEKVVLARQVVVTLQPGADASDIVTRLAADNPGCYSFSVGGLVGASPELLVSLKDGWIKSLALAGTATDPEELESVKMSEEHRHVAESVQSVLGRHLKSIELAEQVTVPHGLMSHIGTRVEGPALPGTTVADVLGDLHPTAAVGGTPTTGAIELIRKVEPVSRGRYAGPVGWFDREGQGVFALALRCGQMNASTMTLYAGGGLLEGSEESAELAETEMKLSPMLTALGYRNS